MTMLMYQQFLLFAEKLMKLSFSETKFPLDALCKIKSWVCEVRNWYYRFYAMCAVFFAASLNIPALVLSFSSLLLSSTALKKSLLLTLSFLSQPPQCVTCTCVEVLAWALWPRSMAGVRGTACAPLTSVWAPRTLPVKCSRPSRDSRWWRKTPMGE